MTGLSLTDRGWAFGTQSYLSFRGLFLWLTPWSYVSNMFVTPLVNVALFALVTRFTLGIEPSRELIVGTATLGLSSMINGGVLQSFTYERDFGTLTVILASRANRVAVYWSRGLLHVGNGLLAATVALIATALVFRLDLSELNPTTLMLSLIAGAAASVAFALFVGNFTLMFRNWLILYGAAQSSILALSGAGIPRDRLTPPLELLSEALPLAHAITAVRAAFDGGSPSSVAGDLGAELAVAAAFGTAGMLLYRWIEYRARVGGEFHE